MKLFILLSLVVCACAQDYTVPGTQIFYGVGCNNTDIYSSDIFLTIPDCVSTCRITTNCSYAQYRHSQCKLYDTCSQFNISSSLLYQLVPSGSGSKSVHLYLLLFMLMFNFDRLSMS